MIIKTGENGKEKRGYKNEQYKSGNVLELGRKALLSSLGIMEKIKKNGLRNKLQPGKPTRVLNDMLQDKNLSLYIGEQTLIIKKINNEFIINDYNQNKNYFCHLGEEYIIGRNGDIQTDTSDKTVSRQHIIISFNNDGEIILRDNNSTNGTEYNFTKKEDFINQRVNTERKEIKEVQRNTDVFSIGDLHGNYLALIGNLLSVGLARRVDGHLEWTGGKNKVVLLGDILADRGTGGIKIIKEIHQLREQAKEQGGDIEIIVGNHEDFMINYFLGGVQNRFGGDSALGVAMYNSQGLGLTELLDYIGIERNGIFDDFYKLGGKSNEILSAMKESQEGRTVLEEICNMKVVSQIDDALFFHTNPTAKMLKYLTTGNIQNNINILNQKYQSYLKNNLLGEGYNTISTEEFNQISDIFLDTRNRPKYGSEEGLENYCEPLRNGGINMIFHGHNEGKDYHIKKIGEITIVDTDYGYGKKGKIDREHSVSLITKDNGTIHMGENVPLYTNPYKEIMGAEIEDNEDGELDIKILNWEKPKN